MFDSRSTATSSGRVLLTPKADRAIFAYISDGGGLLNTAWLTGQNAAHAIVVVKTHEDVHASLPSLW